MCNAERAVQVAIERARKVMRCIGRGRGRPRIVRPRHFEMVKHIANVVDVRETNAAGKVFTDAWVIFKYLGFVSAVPIETVM